MHTDRGSQYGAESYRYPLTQHGMQASMSRSGNCWDNLVAASFFYTLKTALISLEDCDAHDHAKRAVFEYIEVLDPDHGVSHFRRLRTTVGILEVPIPLMLRCCCPAYGPLG